MNQGWCGEYSIVGSSSMRPLYLSPRTFGRPSSTMAKQDKGKYIVRYSDPFSFVRWGDIQDEALEEDMNAWLYKDKEDNHVMKLPLDLYRNGFTMLQRHGYDGTTRLGLNAQGIIEPILPIDNPKHQGLGYSHIEKRSKKSSTPIIVNTPPSIP